MGNLPSPKEVTDWLRKINEIVVVRASEFQIAWKKGLLPQENQCEYMMTMKALQQNVAEIQDSVALKKRSAELEKFRIGINVNPVGAAILRQALCALELYKAATVAHQAVASHIL
jgi:hypothetical protein